jgi:hypothetical protein
MRHLTNAIAVLGVAAVAFLAAGCNKGPAEAALKVADQALEAAKPELAKYTPDELTSLTTAVTDARAQFEKGNYTEALKAAQGLPARIEAAVAAAGAKKDELAKAWADISDAVKPAMDALTAKVAELAATKKLPKGLDAAKVTAAQTDLGAVTAAWAQAGDAFKGGDIPGAVRMAQDVRVKAQALSVMLGLAPAAAPAAVAAK